MYYGCGFGYIQYPYLCTANDELVHLYLKQPTYENCNLFHSKNDDPMVH